MRVIVVDDMLLVQEGLVGLLGERGIDVIAGTSDASNIESLIALHSPDVVILDIRMPPTFTDEGLVAAAEIRLAHPGVAILVLSQYAEPRYAIRLLREVPDRVGYLLKDRVIDIGTVSDALRRMTKAETVIDPSIVASVIGDRRKGTKLEGLTEREREVLALVAEGLSNQVIGRRLVVNEQSVGAHATQIFQKLKLEQSPDLHQRALDVLTYLR
ncbi:MAG: response regulator transcription factor [Ilumatobacteraceae bacterium]